MTELPKEPSAADVDEKDAKDGKDKKDANDGKDEKDGNVGKDADEASLGFDEQTVIETPIPPPELPPDAVLEERGQEGEGQEEKTKSVIARDLGVSRHVSTSNNREEIHVILHGATNLPATSQSRAPCAYAIVKTKSNDDIGSTAEVVTSYNPVPSFGAWWETFGVVTVEERRSTEEVLIFKIVDGPTRQMLAKYHLPVHFLQPFHQYHLEMVVPSVSSSQGIQLIVSITRKLGFIPRNDNASPNYIGLEVLLEGIREELDEPAVGPITAVAKITSSYYPFREDLLFSHHLDWGHVFGVTPTTVLFPNPPVSLFRPSTPRMAGSAQVTLPAPSEENPPVWNHCFLFINERDSATLFNPHSALLIEFYRTRSGMTDLTWRLTNSLGYCVIPLDHNIYRSLAPSATKDTAAVRIEALPLQKCLLTAREKKVPTVSLVLRLITSQRPDSLKTLEGMDELPLIGILQQLMDPKLEFPSHDAMEEILEAKRPRQRPDGATSTRDLAPSGDVKRSPDGVELSSTTNILDFQLNELNAYRDAIRRMERDILGLHDQVRLLQNTNAQLRRQAVSRSPTAIKRTVEETEVVPEATDDGRLSVGEMDAKLWEKTELEERYELLKTRVARQTTQLKEYREKVLRLQNELIKRNEREKEFLRQSEGSGKRSSKESDQTNKKDALERQLEAKTSKIRGLEEACRNQEKIIERMEQLIESKSKGDKERQAARDKIIEENQRLRLENQMLTEQQRVMSRSKKDEEEVLQLRHKLNRDEERIRSLEQQLVENARRWAHDKTDLVTRLEEATNGFQRTSVLDNKRRPVIRTMTWSTDEEDAATATSPSAMKDTAAASAIRPTKSKAAPTTIKTNKRLPNIISSSNY